MDDADTFETAYLFDSTITGTQECDCVMDAGDIGSYGSHPDVAIGDHRLSKKWHRTINRVVDGSKLFITYSTKILVNWWDLQSRLKSKQKVIKIFESYRNIETIS